VGTAEGIITRTMAMDSRNTKVGKSTMGGGENNVVTGERSRTKRRRPWTTSEGKRAVAEWTENACAKRERPWRGACRKTKRGPRIEEVGSRRGERGQGDPLMRMVEISRPVKMVNVVCHI